MGEIFAFCQSSGSSPVSEDFWKICCRSGAACPPHVFKIVGVILSVPGAYCGHSSFKSFAILSFKILIGSLDLMVELFIVGKLLQSSLMKTD